MAAAAITSSSDASRATARVLAFKAEENLNKVSKKPY
jgi:hypothetical protein